MQSDEINMEVSNGRIVIVKRTFENQDNYQNSVTQPHRYYMK